MPKSPRQLALPLPPAPDRAAAPPGGPAPVSTARVEPAARDLAGPVSRSPALDPARALAFERRLAPHLAGPFLLAVTDNRRTMISTRRVGGVLRVRLHHMFLDADDGTVRALGRFLDRRDPRAHDAVRAYVERHGAQIRRTRRRPTLRTAGRVHDLAEILATVARDHFDGPVDVGISWGRHGTPPRGRRRRRSIRLGTYTAEEQLVRVHPVLDRPWVPRFFVAFIVFHEVLHHVIPARVVDGRNVFHPPEFRERERRHPDYARALRWERTNLHRLLAG